MKKLLIILFVCFGFLAKGQVFTPMTAAGYQNKRTKTDSTNYIPTFCGVPTLRSTTAQKQGAIALDSCNKIFYFYDPKTETWNQITGGGSTINIFNDTTILICSGTNVCDTFITNVTANYVSIFNDSTLIVCNTEGACDTININPTNFGVSVVSFTKNATQDSIILTLSDNTRYAVRDNNTGFDTTTVYQNIQNVYNYFSDTSFTNQFFPRGDGVLLDTVIRITDSTLRFIYTDGTQVEDTFRIALTQENITNITNIINYIDSLRGNDTTFILSASNLQSGLKALYSTTDSLSGNDTLHLEFPHNNIAEDSVLTTDVDGDLKMKLVTSGSTITLTTTGTSGPATLIGDVLNIPQYGGGTVYVDTLYRNATRDSLIYTKNSIRYALKGWNDSAYVNLTVLNDSTIIFRRDNGNKDTIRLSAPGLFTSILPGLVPAAGSDTSAVIHASGNWYPVASGGGGLADSAYFWKITGNNGLTPYTHFIGNIDNKPFDGRVNNLRAFHIDSLATGAQTTTYGRTTFGYEAGLIAVGVKGQRSTYLGYRAGKAQDSTDNTIVGFGSYIATGAGTQNTVVGAGSGKLITNGTFNTIVGANSGNGQTTANSNTYFGYNIANLNTGSSNVAIGTGNLAGTGAGGQNTAVGSGALGAVTGGNQSTAVGINALAASASSNSNTSIGALSLTATTGADNAALGASAGRFNTTGASQIFINSLSRTNYAGDTSQSPFYAQQSTTLTSQKVSLNGIIGINTASPASTAVLDISHSNIYKGVLIPRMSTGKRDSLWSSILTSTKTANGSSYGAGPFTNIPLVCMTCADSRATGAVAASITTGAGVLSAVTSFLGGKYYRVGDVLAPDSTAMGSVGSGGRVTVSTTGLAVSRGLSTYDTTMDLHITVNSNDPILQAGWFYKAVTATYTITKNDYTLDCTSGTFTITLPTAVGIAGRIYKIVNSGSGTITLGTTSSQTFTNINATPTTLTLGAVAAAAITGYEVQSNGANWLVTGKVKNE